MVKPETIRFDPQQLQALCDYCDITGTKPERALYDALSDFLECCVPPLLEEFVERSGGSFGQTN
jgi:hypothetical protein